MLWDVILHSWIWKNKHNMEKAPMKFPAVKPTFVISHPYVTTHLPQLFTVVSWTVVFRGIMVSDKNKQRIFLDADHQKTSENVINMCRWTHRVWTLCSTLKHDCSLIVINAILCIASAHFFLNLILQDIERQKWREVSDEALDDKHRLLK